ncbi:hypothetical protein LA733_1107 [Leptospira interrogans]|nr:hypothetical protein LA733_1107 [Leptospira interrogans]KWV28342.1 hypothetical protein LA702_0947 [Leptospira interrogans]
MFQCKNSDKENALLLAGASLIIAQELEAQSLMSGPVLIDQETELTNYQFKFYNSTQKLTLEAYFSKPAGMGPFPLIVMMHGCAGAHSNSDASKPPSSLYTEWAVEVKL